MCHFTRTVSSPLAKTWTCDLSSLMWFPKTTEGSPFTIDENLTYSWLKTSILFFNYKATWTTQGNPNYRHLRIPFGVYFENAVSDAKPFLRPPWAVERLVWAVERAAPWAKEKALGTPRRDKHGERTAEIRWAFKRSSFWCNCWCVHRSRGQLAVSALKGGCPSYSLCLPFGFSSFVSECRLCLSALSPWKFPSLFCCSIFWNLSFVLTVGVHPQLKNCILLGGSSHPVNGSLDHPHL